MKKVKQITLSLICMFCFFSFDLTAHNEVLLELKRCFKQLENTVMTPQKYKVKLSAVREMLRSLQEEKTENYVWEGLFLIDLLTSCDLDKGASCEACKIWHQQESIDFLSDSFALLSQNQWGRNQIIEALIKNYLKTLDSYIDRIVLQKLKKNVLEVQLLDLNVKKIEDELACLLEVGDGQAQAVLELDDLLERDEIIVDDVAKLIAELEGKINISSLPHPSSF